jgi:hypothetical protein
MGVSVSLVGPAFGRGGVSGCSYSRVFVLEVVKLCVQRWKRSYIMVVGMEAIFDNKLSQMR